VRVFTCMCVCMCVSVCVCVCGWVGGWVQESDFTSELTNAPAALWHIIFDDTELGEVRVRVCEGETERVRQKKRKRGGRGWEREKEGERESVCGALFWKTLSYGSCVCVHAR